MEPRHEQRLRLSYSQTGLMKYVGHLDLVRAWERVLRRANIPMAYSRGYNPQPKLQFASALPLGATGREELADIILTDAMAPETFRLRVQPQLPAGLQLLEVWPVPVKSKALQGLLRASQWQVDVQTEQSVEAVSQLVDDLLAAPTLPSTRQRKGRARAYDLRPLVLVLTYQGQLEQGWHRLSMTLSSGPSATGRPDAVLAALGLADGPVRLERVRCIFAQNIHGPEIDCGA